MGLLKLLFNISQNLTLISEQCMWARVTLRSKDSALANCRHMINPMKLSILSSALLFIPLLDGLWDMVCSIWCGKTYKGSPGNHCFLNHYANIGLTVTMSRLVDSWPTVFFKTRGHLSRLAWPTQRDGLSCLASPRLALRCAAWPGKTNPDSWSRPLATSGCLHRYYNSIVHNATCINIPFFSVRQAVFLYKKECLKW